VSRAEDPVARAERVTAELREASREAAGVLKDLRVLMKSAREQVDGYYSANVKAALDEHTQTWTADVDQWWSDAKADLQRMVDLAIKQAGPVIVNASRLEALCQAIAEEVAAHTVYTEDGPYVDYAVDHRQPGLEPG
jgi:hypothetical protein